MLNSPQNIDPRRQAKFLYWQGWSITAIADNLGERRSTVGSWKRRDKWDNAPTIERIEGAAEHRLVQLLTKPNKTGGDFKEIDLISRQMERYARVRKYLYDGSEVDLSPAIAQRNEKKKAKKNFFTDEQIDMLVEAFEASLFEYQETWYQTKDQRTRMILKSRQIGATWFFAREAFIDALLTGRNQIFISASKAQAHVFKGYILEFVRQTVGIDLRGDPIVLFNDATLYFLGTNFRTAQSYHGNLYIDEFFWIPGFAKLNAVASGMAMHKKWRKTLFSTPSAMSHEAYPLWAGERGKTDDIKMDVSHKALKDGKICSDGIWRQIVTVFDAESGGCDLFDIDELRREYTEDEFDNLLLCQFIDDTKSVFSWNLLQTCMVDSWEVWSDLKPHAAKPFANKEVWLGYDPAATGDCQGLVAIAPPAVPGGKFRVLERLQFRGLDYQQQAEEIRKLTNKYRVTYIGIDVTGMGAAVHELVVKFFPTAKAITYSVEVKTAMVLKMQNVMRNGRFEFDAGSVDLAQSFLSIRKVITPSGRQATYASGRTTAVGHADLAWATMHAIYHEPLDGNPQGSESVMELS